MSAGIISSEAIVGGKTITLKKAAKAGAEIINAYGTPHDLSRPGQALLSRIEKVSASLNKDQPLVVLMGENHGAPSHKLLQAYVVKGLLDRKAKAAVSFEVPHNYLGRLVDRNTGLSLSVEEKARLAQLDKTGQRSLVTTIAFGESPFAPLASNTIMDFYRQSGIPARFTDAAIKIKKRPLRFYSDKPVMEALLDQDDALTASLVSHHKGVAGIREVSAVEPMGMAIRNEMMAAQAMTHMKHSGATILVHQCGRDHLFGNRTDGQNPYEESLSARFSKLGAAVLPVFITVGMGGLETMPYEARQALSSAMIINGMAAMRFMNTDPGERSFIEALNRHSGTDFKVPGDDVTKWLQEDIRQVAPQWLAEARGGPSGP